jgi:hypothetical protein
VGLVLWREVPGQQRVEVGRLGGRKALEHVREIGVGSMPLSLADSISV